MDSDFAACLRLLRTGDAAECYRRLTAVLAEQPDDLDARFLLALIALPSDSRENALDLADPLAATSRRTGDDYERVADGLRAAGLEKLAASVFKIAANIDKHDLDRPHPWGDRPFNGDARREDMFRRLVKAVEIGTVVETGTFRGSTTVFLRQASGVDVYSCELNDRAFEYAADRLAGLPEIHLFRMDSRAFLAELGNDEAIRHKTVFFYLDAHWNADLPLVEELRLILSRFDAPVVMIDDFEVAHRTDYEFDYYGENAVLSVDLLAPVLREDMVLLYPNWPADPTVGSRRGFVILTNRRLADAIGGQLDDFLRFDRFEAALRQMRRYRALLCRIAPNLRDLEERIAGVMCAERHLDATRQKLDEAEKHAASQQHAIRDMERELLAERDGNQRTRQNMEREFTLERRGHQRALRGMERELILERHSHQHALRGLERELSVERDGHQRVREDLERDLSAKENENSALRRRVTDAEATIESIHRSTVWRRTRWLVRQVDRAYRLRRSSGREILAKGRRVLFPIGSRRERVYIALIRPLLRSSPAQAAEMPAAELPVVELPVVEMPVVEMPAVEMPVAEIPAPAALSASEPSLRSPDIDLGPLKFIPHDGGFFSNFNFLVGEMYLGRAVYPLFSETEAIRYNKSLKHFAYVDRGRENSWFDFFEPIAYFPGDALHSDTAYISRLPDTWGHLAAPEFRLPAATMRLYRRDDFQDWRWAVHHAVADKLRVAPDIRVSIDDMLARMPGRRIGVHVRHPSHLVEQGSIFFDDYFLAIDRIRGEYPASSLFLATDNDLAIAAFTQRYGDAVFCYPGFIRQSIDDVLEWVYSLSQASLDDMGFVGGVGFQTHYKLAAAGGGLDGVRAGKEAVTDVFTLAACDDFVCTASNFTLTCAFMNPRQTQHLVSKGMDISSRKNWSEMAPGDLP